MSELERLDEALEWFDDRNQDFVESFEPLLVLADAARAYRGLLANGERVTWCKTHFDGWATVGACRNGIAEGESHRCVKVFRLLSLYPKEAENEPD